MMGGGALVLGGGGITGVAWEIGVLAGLAARGIDLTMADLVVGTSAGAVVAAQVTSGTPLALLYRAQLTPPAGDIKARMGLRAKLTFVWAVMRSPDTVTACTRVGRMAVASPPVPGHYRRAVIAARLPSHAWPSRRLLITAVDVATGQFNAFHDRSGVDLIDAVSASCAVPGVWPPVRLNGRLWMDGGMRSAANADLASGCRRVVIIAPLARGLAPMASVAEQADALRRAGARVEAITPGRAARAAIGRDLLDPARAASAARAGHAQGIQEAARIAELWAPRALPSPA
jgi:NTE family protein